MPKNSIHPTWYDNAKVYCDGQLIMKVGSTQPKLNVDILSKSKRETPEHIRLGKFKA